MILRLNFFHRYISHFCLFNFEDVLRTLKFTCKICPLCMRMEKFGLKNKYIISNWIIITRLIEDSEFDACFLGETKV